jgi:hypothetical protein
LMIRFHLADPELVHATELNRANDETIPVKYVW